MKIVEPISHNQVNSLIASEDYFSLEDAYKGQGLTPLYPTNMHPKVYFCVLTTLAGTIFIGIAKDMLNHEITEKEITFLKASARQDAFNKLAAAVHHDIQTDFL